MIFECELIEGENKSNVTILLIKTPNGKAYMVVYAKGRYGAFIQIFQVVDGHMTITENVSSSAKGKWLAQPKGLLTFVSGIGTKDFKSCGSNQYCFVKSSDEIFEADFSNFTPIKRVTQHNLRQLYPKMEDVKNVGEENLVVKINKLINIDGVKYDSITKLSLEGSGLSSIPKEIRCLKNLQALDLNNNAISKISENLFSSELRLVVTLTYLDLSENAIEELPRSLFNLKNLQELYLNENFIKYVPSEINNLRKLERLWIYQNHLRWLPTSILNLPSLKMCNFEDNLFDQLHLEPIRVNQNNKCRVILYKNAYNFSQTNYPIKMFVSHDERKDGQLVALVEVIKLDSVYKPQKFLIEMGSFSRESFYEKYMEIKE